MSRSVDLWLLSLEQMGSRSSSTVSRRLCIASSDYLLRARNLHEGFLRFMTTSFGVTPRARTASITLVKMV